MNMWSVRYSSSVTCVQLPYQVHCSKLLESADLCSYPLFISVPLIYSLGLDSPGNRTCGTSAASAFVQRKAHSQQMKM